MSVRLHHRELNREITVPSKRSAAVLARSGWEPVETKSESAKAAVKPTEKKEG